MDNTHITETISTMLTSLGIAYDSITTSAQAGSTVFTIATAESGKLIGHNGETLQALNHLLKRMMEKDGDEKQHFSIDVNGYQARRIKSIEDQARLVAERARTFRYDVEMSPMSSYERMIVHSTLKAMPDITTSSSGEGPTRHIVVRYIDPTLPKVTEDTSTDQG